MLDFPRRCKELDPAAQKFLLFIACNTITWQCIAGPALVLFAREIRMPESRVGLLQAIMPLCMILIIFTTSMVERMGPKRLLVAGWMARALTASLVFLMPLAMAWWGDPGGWNMLTLAILGFCVIRALSVSGWFPWLHEIVPIHQRGLYFGLEMVTFQGVTVALALILSLILQTGTGLGRFYAVYAVGIGSGIFSLALIRMIPGGEGLEIDPNRKTGPSVYAQVLTDGAFLWFCLRSASGLVCLTLVTAASMMYLRDILGMSPARAMMVNAAGGLAVALTINWWGTYLDRHGSGPGMFLALAGHSMGTALWLFLKPDSLWSQWVVWPSYMVTMAFGAAFQIGRNQGLLGRIRQEGKVAYTNLYIFIDALAMGVTPVVVGILIERHALWGYQLCFFVSCLAGLVLALPNLWALEADKLPAPYMGPLIRTTLPLRGMARAMWLSMGLYSGRVRHSPDAFPRTHPQAPILPEEGTDHGL